MSYSKALIKTQSGINLSAHIWSPPQEPIALIHIFHGMMEHGLTYKSVATHFTQLGFLVVSHDHRGHGSTGQRETGIGHFGPKANWKTVIQDCSDAHLYFKEHYPNIPFILLGHSMGSFLALHTLKRHKTFFQGVLLSGSTYESPLKMKASLLLAFSLKSIFGSQSKSNLLHQIIFGAYNHHFKDSKTTADWLSRDSSFVSQYLADPLSGNVCSLGFYKELFSMVSTLFQPGYVSTIRSDIPIFLFSGADDPVGHFGLGVKKLDEFLKKEGLIDITQKLYAQSRHVILQEKNKEEVYKDIYQWINCHFL